MNELMRVQRITYAANYLQAKSGDS